ncbi:fimbrial protein [Providencia sp.]|uniref:fimbrial protein n=1 Tax=Providencia sp. TaxID=589 RepID=UPI0026BE7CBE
MMKRGTLITVFRHGLLALCGAVSLVSQAVEVNFTGNLINNPPCDVSGPDGPNQPIKVTFNELGITKIDGLGDKTEYGRQDFTLTLSCGAGLGNAVALYLEYRGMSAPFDPSNKTLQASQAGLGIRLYHQGVLIAPNSGTPMTMSDNGVLTLPLYAVPVKDTRPGVTLYEDEFTATASVEMNYP